MSAGSNRIKGWIFPAACCLVLYLAAGSFAADIRYPAEITDASGTTIKVEQPFRRILVVGTAPFIALHMLYMFDQAKDHLAGFETKVKQTDGFLNIIDPKLNEKQKLGSNPGPESIAALRPDLVIAKGTVRGPLSRSLEKLGIPMLYLGAENPDMFFEDIRMLGTVFGDKKRAGEIIGYFEKCLNKVQQKTADISEDEKKRVLLLEYSNRGKQLTLKVPATSWVQTRQVITAHGQPVWMDQGFSGDGWQMTGFEQVAAWNPEQIFVVVWYRLKGRRILNKLYSDSRWARLSAVKQGQLYLFPKDIYGWDAATPRWIMGVMWLAAMMYPDRFGSLDEKQMAGQFYKTLYHLEDSVIEQQIFPEMYPDESPE